MRWTVNKDFLARFFRLSWEFPGLITDVQKALLESSSRLNMLLYCVSFQVLRRAHEVE